VSPFKAILEYELTHSIPPGYINHTISSTAPNGAWQRIERGELVLGDEWYAYIFCASPHMGKIFRGNLEIYARIR
jgi:hypothetical protein